MFSWASFVHTYKKFWMWNCWVKRKVFSLFFSFLSKHTYQLECQFSCPLAVPHYYLIVCPNNPGRKWHTIIVVFLIACDIGHYVLLHMLEFNIFPYELLVILFAQLFKKMLSSRLLRLKIYMVKNIHDFGKVFQPKEVYFYFKIPTNFWKNLPMFTEV